MLFKLTDNVGKSISRRLSLLRCFSAFELLKVNWLLGPIKVTNTKLLKTHDGEDLTIRYEDLFTFNEIFVDGEYSKLSKMGIHPELIVDVGANVGFATRYFLSLWPQTKVLAFEPVESNYIQFVYNTTGYANVKCHNYGLATVSRTTRFVFNGGGSCEDMANGSEHVELCDFFEKLHELHIDILKIDIEGEERNIIADERFNELLSRVVTLVIELHGTRELRDSLVYKLDEISSKLGKRVIRDRVIFDNAEIVWVY